MKIEIETASVSDKGLNPQKSINEDSYLVLKKERMFAVADGVGGAHAGDVASQTALETIKNVIVTLNQTQNKVSNDLLNVLMDLINAGNEVIYEIGQKKHRMVATTIAIMLVKNEIAIIGNVGDSRIYVVRNGKLLRLTKDHSKLQSLLDQNPKISIDRAEFRDGHVITRALGVNASVEPYIQKVILKHDDIFVLCTDGIYIHNTDDEILNNVNENRNDLAKVCEVLKENCYKNGAKDHLTAVVLKIKFKNEDDLDPHSKRTSNDLMDTFIKRN